MPWFSLNLSPLACSINQSISQSIEAWLDHTVQRSTYALYIVHQTIPFLQKWDYACPNSGGHDILKAELTHLVWYSVMVYMPSYTHETTFRLPVVTWHYYTCQDFPPFHPLSYFADMNLWKFLLSHQVAVLFYTWPLETHAHTQLDEPFLKVIIWFQRCEVVNTGDWSGKNGAWCAKPKHCYYNQDSCKVRQKDTTSICQCHSHS